MNIWVTLSSQEAWKKHKPAGVKWFLYSERNLAKENVRLMMSLWRAIINFNYWLVHIVLVCSLERKHQVRRVNGNTVETWLMANALLQPPNPGNNKSSVSDFHFFTLTVNIGNFFSFGLLVTRLTSFTIL